MAESSSCAADSGAKLVFACSGAADVGAIADGAARRMNADGVAKMFCLAGVGGRVEPILDTTAKADAIVAIDGCPMDCAKHTLDQAGFSGFGSVRITDLGMDKGETPVTAERVDIVVRSATQALGA